MNLSISSRCWQGSNSTCPGPLHGCQCDCHATHRRQDHIISLRCQTAAHSSCVSDDVCECSCHTKRKFDSALLTEREQGILRNASSPFFEDVVTYAVDHTLELLTTICELRAERLHNYRANGCLCVLGCSVNGDCPLHGDKAMHVRHDAVSSSAIRNLRAVVENHVIMEKQDIVELVRVALSALTK